MTTACANPLLATPARPLPRSVAVIGAETIGPDIGYYLKSALPDLKLYLVDVSQEALDGALLRLRDYSKKAVAKGKMSKAEAAAATAKVVGTLDYADIADCDWVIETATENLAQKRKILARIEAVVRPDALITANTSSLPAAQIFSALKHKQRATVTHFFAPAWRNPVVEVIRWRKTDPAVVEYLRWLFCMTGKVPLVTDDVVCFMLGRIFGNWCNEAALLLNQASAAEIDSVAVEFAHAGPFHVLNLASGNPLVTEINALQAQQEGGHYLPVPAFRSVQTWLTVPPDKPIEVAAATAKALRERLLGVLFAQSADIVDRRIGDAADLDLGCRLAFGFRHGPFELMRLLGEKISGRAMTRVHTERPGMPMPQRVFSAYQNFLRHILVDDVGGVKVITLRRSEALNALNDAMTNEILSIIKRCEKDPKVTGFVLVGYGTRAFCAGTDIGHFFELLGDAWAAEEYARDCSRLLVHLDQMTKPVVAALNGMALGGGFELAMRCHGIVALKSAWMQMPEVTLGIVPGFGGMVAPYRRWPHAAATFNAMLRRAERLKASRAHELGVVDALANDHPSLIGKAVARVAELSGKVEPIPDAPLAVNIDPIEAKAVGGQVLSRECMALLEKGIRDAAAAPSFAAALEAGYQAFGKSACTEAAREGITSFKEKRQANFSKKK